MRDNAVAFIGALVAAGLNYLFYPILGRFLSTTQFGEVQVLATLTVQAGLIFGLARIAVIGEVLQAKTKAATTQIVQFAERLLLQLSIVLTLLAIAAAPLLAHFLQLRSMVPLFIIMPSLACNALTASRDSYLRAQGKFGFSAVSQIVTAFTKLCIATLLAAFGLGTAGALLGLTAAYGIAALLIIVITARMGLKTSLKRMLSFDALVSVFKKGNVGKKGVRTLGVSAASLVVVVLSSIDTVTAKLVLQPAVAGLYTGISVVGNISLFATGSIAGVLLASTSRAKPYAQNIHKYKMSALFTLGIGGSIVLASVLLPQFIVRVMLGVTYTPLAHLLPTLAVAMLAMAGVNLIVSYHIAMRDTAVIAVAAAVALLVIGALVLQHDTPTQIAQSFLRGNLASLILCIGWTLYKHNRDR